MYPYLHTNTDAICRLLRQRVIDKTGWPEDTIFWASSGRPTLQVQYPPADRFVVLVVEDLRVNPEDYARLGREWTCFAMTCDTYVCQRSQQDQELRLTRLTESQDGIYASLRAVVNALQGWMAPDGSFLEPVQLESVTPPFQAVDDVHWYAAVARWKVYFALDLPAWSDAR